MSVTTARPPSSRPRPPTPRQRAEVERLLDPDRTRALTDRQNALCRRVFEYDREQGKAHGEQTTQALKDLERQRADYDPANPANWAKDDRPIGDRIERISPGVNRRTLDCLHVQQGVAPEHEHRVTLTTGNVSALLTARFCTGCWELMRAGGRVEVARYGQEVFEIAFTNLDNVKRAPQNVVESREQATRTVNGWPVPVVRSRGQYRAAMADFAEELATGRLKAHTFRLIVEALDADMTAAENGADTVEPHAWRPGMPDRVKAQNGRPRPVWKGANNNN